MYYFIGQCCCIVLNYVKDVCTMLITSETSGMSSYKYVLRSSWNKMRGWANKNATIRLTFPHSIS